MNKIQKSEQSPSIEEIKRYEDRDSVQIKLVNDSGQLGEHIERIAKSELEKNVFSAKYLIQSEVSEIPLLVDPLIKSSGLIVFAGDSDTGKSTVLRQLCIDVVNGRSTFLEFPLNARHKRAIYVSTEDDEDSISVMLKKARETLKIDEDSIAGLDFVFSSENVPETIIHLIESRGDVDLIIIDCLDDLFSGDMNQSNKIRTFLNPFSDIARDYKCTIIVLKHFRKGSQASKPHKDMIAGSHGLQSKARAALLWVKDPDDSLIRHLIIGKGNYISSELKDQSFAFRFDETTMTMQNTGERRSLFELASSDDRDNQKKQVKQLIESGMKQRDIEAETGVPQSTISKWKAAYNW
jgi:RecA-family ATPase